MGIERREILISDSDIVISCCNSKQKLRVELNSIFRIYEGTFLLVEIEEGRELLLVTDNLGSRRVIMKLQNSGQQVGYLTELFSVIGMDVNFKNVRVLNPTDDVRKWNVNYNAMQDYNARRLTIMNT
mgnify:CR=1 FL=1